MKKQCKRKKKKLRSDVQQEAKNKKARQSSAAAAAAVAYPLAVVTQLTQPQASNVVIDSSIAVVADSFGSLITPGTAELLHVDRAKQARLSSAAAAASPLAVVTQPSQLSWSSNADRDSTLDSFGTVGTGGTPATEDPASLAGSAVQRSYVARQVKNVKIGKADIIHWLHDIGPPPAHPTIDAHSFKTRARFLHSPPKRLPVLYLLLNVVCKPVLHQGPTLRRHQPYLRLQSVTLPAPMLPVLHPSLV
jgi:hypothetical protein